MTVDYPTGPPRLKSGKLLKTAWRIFLAAGLAWACLCQTPPTAEASEGYVAVACLRRNAGLCGVINENGAWVIKPEFDRISDFAPNGRAVAFKRQRPGIIDTQGEWVIPPGFDRVGEEWSAGLIKVGRSDRKTGMVYGLADESGRLVVEPAFREIQSFGPNRLAGACDQEGQCGFIDRRGAWAVPPVFGRVEAFSENGLAPAKRPGEELWGYINAAGAFVIPPSFEAAFPFYSDRAKVFSGGSFHLINSKGKAVGKLKFTTLGDFDSGGLAPAQQETDGPFGLVNRSGAWAVQPRFERVFSFDGGNLAPAQQDGFFGFINRRGQWVIKPSFGNVDDFERRGNRAPAQLSGAWGMIDSEGRWVVNPDHLLLLNTGVAHGPIQVFAGNGRWGLMDEDGRWLLEPMLTASPYFAANGLSEAKVGKLYGFINRFGHWVVEPAFQQVGAFRPVPIVPPAWPAEAGPSVAANQPTRLIVDSGSAAAPGLTASKKPRQTQSRSRPKTEENAPAEPRRRVPVRQEQKPTRIVVPDKPSAPSPAAAEAAIAEQPKSADEASSLSPPLGYIPPEESAPARRIRQAQQLRPAAAAPQPRPAEPQMPEPTTEPTSDRASAPTPDPAAPTKAEASDTQATTPQTIPETDRENF